MNLMVKLFITLFVIAFVGLFVLKKPDGTPWLSLNEFMPTTEGLTIDLPDLPDHNDSSTDASADNIYRWKDENGHWQFSDTPPTGLIAERIEVTGDLNQDIAEPPPLIPEQTAEVTTTSVDTSSPLPIAPTTISPDKIQKLMEDTQNIQNIMDSRQAELDGL